MLNDLVREEIEQRQNNSLMRVSFDWNNDINGIVAPIIVNRQMKGPLSNMGLRSAVVICMIILLLKNIFRDMAG